MDKLEAVQRALRFSTRTLKWCEEEHQLFFDDFDSYNVNDYDSRFGEVADAIIREAIAENIFAEEDIED
ncbi:MAG: hypothetical protein VYC17_01545 [Nitrospinota bacterium]|nr:hypothetical protein [Nitrospinota bacterium]